ncbi:MAG: SMC family ATPase [Anaerolineae bacterium]|nr:SMC family ATPase [Anaerolineae bacterium]
MIPLQLRVRNFMCYRDNVPPLQFDGIHLACLAGANGHGKSALLDAITWALWGKARAKRDDELIHMGESEMEVEFIFDLGGNAYRVLRKRDSTGRGRTILDLQVQHDGDFHSIAESGVRATQEAIIRLLRMDYETFTNSAFLVQGKADAFTTRTPAERKQVLGEILGLGIYDEYEQRAKEKVKEKDRQLAELEGVLRDIDRELALEPEYEAELAQARERATQLAETLREAEGELLQLRHQYQSLEHQQARLRDLDRRLQQAEQELRDVEAQIAERGTRLAHYESVLARSTEVEAGYARFVQARKDEAAWNERLAQYARVQEQQRAVERVLDAARHELELACSRLKERVTDLGRRAAKVDKLAGDLAEAGARLAALEADQAARDATQARIQALNEEAAGLKVRNEQLLAEMEALRKKLDVLVDERGEATCPLCGQALSGEHREELEEQFEHEGMALKENYRANDARAREIEAETRQLQGEVTQLDRKLATLPAQQRHEAQLEQALADARQAAAELEDGNAELAALESRLAQGDYAQEDQARLQRLVSELESLDYDPNAHGQARDDVAALAEFEAQYQALQTARERIDEERQALAGLRTRQERWQQSLAEDQAQRGALATEVARLPSVKQDMEGKAHHVEDLQAQASRARQALGAAQQKLDHCSYLAAERVRRVAERQRAAEEKAVFEELRLAFGKKGVQAMIIEAAIPEIEYEANRLLARMTEGRMHVRFETQRETLKGDTLETLDINIADELGTRSYELFSGGEAFRVNFAIRVALSKLLARRAGAQLQFLVIDEGFGTQDAEGRQRLVEAINSVQDDFARILAITHIEELKDAFPVRIEVTKTANGSQFRLN